MDLPKKFTGKGNEINVIIDTPRGSNHKYKYDKKFNGFKLNSVLPAGTVFPLNFGFIPGTKGEDGDQIDVLVISDHSFITGCLLECRLIGVIEAVQKDGKNPGERNDRLVAVPTESHIHSSLKSLLDMDKNHLREIIDFFKYYNALRGGKFELLGVKGPAVALKCIKK